jgi:hypothetical protein
MNSNFKNILEYIAKEGEIYDTYSTALFMYSLLKMKKPKNFIEFGTGLGCTSFMAAQAFQENGFGKVYTFDNGEHWTGYGKEGTYKSFIENKIKELNIKKQIKFEFGDIYINKLKVKEKLDFVFFDFYKEPLALLDMFAYIFPKVNKYCNVFVDSAPCFWPAYSMLTMLIDTLQKGKIPETMYELCPEKDKLKHLVSTSKFTLLNIRKRDNSAHQNGIAWIKVEPQDVLVRSLKNEDYT